MNDTTSLRRTTDAEVLAPAATRDYTQTPAYEIPVLKGVAMKLADIQGMTGLRVARRNVA